MFRHIRITHSGFRRLGILHDIVQIGDGVFQTVLVRAHSAALSVDILQGLLKIRDGLFRALGGTEVHILDLKSTCGDGGQFYRDR